MPGLKDKFLFEGSIHSRQAQNGEFSSNNGAFFTAIDFQDIAAQQAHLNLSEPLPYYGGNGATISNEVIAGQGG
tara:strand:- start:24 stop:245 length:222 start_codon:yes stop_codon:yes gene_type:complete